MAMTREDLRIKALEIVVQANKASGQLITGSYLIKQAEQIEQYIEHGSEKEAQVDGARG